MAAAATTILDLLKGDEEMGDWPEPKFQEVVNLLKDNEVTTPGHLKGLHFDDLTWPKECPIKGVGKALLRRTLERLQVSAAPHGLAVAPGALRPPLRKAGNKSAGHGGPGAELVKPPEAQWVADGPVFRVRSAPHAVAGA